MRPAIYNVGRVSIDAYRTTVRGQSATVWIIEKMNEGKKEF